MKRRLLIATIMFSLVIGIVSYAGNWIGSNETGWRYQNNDGSYVTGTWYQDTDGAWYYFGPDSLMKHDTWIDGMYYVDSSGKMMTNAITPDGYQVGSDGKWIQNTAGQTSSASFEEIVNLFRASFAEGNNETIQFINVFGENNNTVVVTANLVGDSNLPELDELYVAYAKIAVEAAFPEALQAASMAYGQKVYLKVNYMMNGRLYDTVTY